MICNTQIGSSCRCFGRVELAAEPAGSTGSPVSTDQDLTEKGVIDAGGGDAYDALMGVYRVE
ncbi:hypothetical protein JW859_05415 [bacterium]|nr:hypothetical protein [bacterium]